MKRLTPRSLTLRLTLLFASLSTAVLLLLGVLVGSLVESHFADMDRILLEGKLEFLRFNLEQVRSQDDLLALPARLDQALRGHHGLAVQVLSPEGKPLFASTAAAFPKTLLGTAPGQDGELLAWHDAASHTAYRGLAASVQTRLPGSGPMQVAVATDMAIHHHFMDSFRSTLWPAVGLAALLSGFLGWVAARRGLAPLEEMRHRAAKITANRLHQRLSATDIPEELAAVAQTLNAMLGRLEESFRRLSDFSSDLAHELRTPVTNLLTQTQVTLSRPRAPAEYQEVLASNSEELERLSRMIGDMLFLAKADNELIVPHREMVDLGQEAASLLEFYEALASDKGIAVSLRGQLQVSGDRLMLRRAINNLLSNALRHTPEGGRIEVELADGSPDQVVLSVTNTGPTIAPQHLPRLFDRFYRADASRQRFSSGAGLGLAITRSILLAHGGDARVWSRDGLTRFELVLPRSPGG